MFRTDIRYEREEYGRAQAPLGLSLPVIELGEGGRVFAHLSKPKSHIQTGIGPSVLIETDMGPVAACDITPNHKVLTLENGYCSVLWAGQERQEMAAHSVGKPIRIAPGTLGKGNHSKHALFGAGQNILVRHAMNELFFGASDVLVKTDFLTHVSGIERSENHQVVNWVHLLFDRVEIVQAEGLWVESMAPNMEALRYASNEFSTEIENAVPALRYERGYAAYGHNQPVLNMNEVKMLALKGA